MEPNNPEPIDAEVVSEAPGTPEKNTLMAVLAYLGILVLIPLLTTKDDSFVKYHVKQGLVLLVIWAVVWGVGMSAYLFWHVTQLIHLGLVVLSIIGIVNAVRGEEKELPLVGQFGTKFNI